MNHGKITEGLAKICKDNCPICIKAREKGKGLSYNFVKIEKHFCPACRCYKKVYGKPAHEKL
jgi:hypothetical protein